MNCFVCDEGTLQHRLADVEGKVKGEKFVVRTNALVCDACGHVAVEGADMSEFMRSLADAYRRAHNLLTSEEIKHIRGGPWPAGAGFAVAESGPSQRKTLGARVGPGRTK